MFGKPAAARAIAMILLIIACLAYLPIILLHDKPWWPLDWTKLPQTQIWGSHTLIPKRRATAILAVSLSSNRPNWWDGIACNHFEDVFVDDARRMARSIKSLVESSSLNICFTRNESHEAWQHFLSGSTGVQSDGYDSVEATNWSFKMLKLTLARIRLDSSWHW